MKLSNKPLQVGAISLMIASALTGCNSGSSSQSKTVELVSANDAPELIEHPIEQPVIQPVIQPTTQELIDQPIVTAPQIELTPSTPVIIEPQPPKLPIFIGEGIATHTQQPYSGTITKGGDAYLRYNQDATTMDKFELPEWKVEYKFQPFLEVLITSGGETLCARYSWKLQGFGYAKKQCLWSDTRQAVPLEDMKSAYYGYSVIESRVWVSGVVGLGVVVE